MTDGTRPNENERTAASPPVPPYAAGPQSAPPPPPPQAAPSPYAAPLPPYAAQAASGAPGAYGAPRQDYPGAPPTWGPPTGGPAPGAPWNPGPPQGGSSVLAVLALVASILGALISFIPFFGSVLAWALFATAIVLAIIALVKKTPGKGMSIAALIITGAGFLLSIVWAVILFAFGVFGSALSPGSSSGSESSPAPDDEYYSYPMLGTPDFGADGNTVSAPLVPGSTITITDDNVSEDVWQLTVLPFEDLTAAAAATGDIEPAFGAYVGVPVQLTNVTDETIDLTVDYAYLPYTRFLTADGGEAELTFLSDIESYPSAWDVEVIEPGETVTFYEVFDLAPDAVASGYYVLDLDSGQTVFWGAATL
ncbi:DUF4190 domain-containing protein [Microbacterium hatanonis]|uniref:DUF4190 domain-containing protein n=1 Tax=Microbacterium hatanonis TaxID=404366 RepID=A0A5C8I191_9MICO|nr:DUF4190 domain-containing protein [Microbacterium hatanonis]TXK12747.1 DUF4190 domain-containing protein [Microbacterium hatanonis]